MTNPYDPKRDQEAEKLLSGISGLRFRPLVNGADLREVRKVLDVLPKLELPIHSAGELIERLGGAERYLDVVGVEVNPLRMIKYMPAYYFPITSLENLIEKMAELVRQNRPQVDVPAELGSLKKALPDLKFPIETADEMLSQVKERQATIRFRGQVMDPEVVVKEAPPGFFPIRSQDEFDQKVAQAMRDRPLIVKD